MVIKKIKKIRYRIEQENEYFFINQKLYTFVFWQECGDIWRVTTSIKAPNIFEAIRKFKEWLNGHN